MRRLGIGGETRLTVRRRRDETSETPTLVVVVVVVEAWVVVAGGEVPGGGGGGCPVSAPGPGAGPGCGHGGGKELGGGIRSGETRRDAEAEVVFPRPRSGSVLRRSSRWRWRTTGHLPSAGGSGLPRSGRGRPRWPSRDFESPKPSAKSGTWRTGLPRFRERRLEARSSRWSGAAAPARTPEGAGTSPASPSRPRFGVRGFFPRKVFAALESLVSRIKTF